MNNEIWELVGIIIGDGNLWTDGKSACRIEVTGDIVKDRDFIFNRVNQLFSSFTRNKIVIKERSNALRIMVVSKEFFVVLTSLVLRWGRDKIKNLEFLNNLDLNQSKLVLRGLMDTDGCIVLRSNRQVFGQIATNSEFLAKWIERTLKKLGLRPFIAHSRNRKVGTITFRVWLSGRENLQKWLDIIGFSNKLKLLKTLEILSRGGNKGRYHLKVPYAQPDLSEVKENGLVSNRSVCC